MREINISKNEANQRLNKFLEKYLNKAPKSFIYKMIRKKNIKINDSKADGSEILTEGDILKLYLSEETIEKFMQEKTINEEAGAISIIFEDENILIVDKPLGVLSHPDTNTDRDTLIDRILSYLHKKGEFNIEKNSSFTPAICNRLDRNTGGLVVCGKNLATVQKLNEIIASGNMYKYYFAIVSGKLETKGKLEGYHIKDDNTNQVKITKQESQNGKKVYTEYTPVKYTDDFTMLNINLITGKSHQIRAHLQSIGHPILGDRKYGDSDVNKWAKERFAVNNQLLHAQKISFDEIDGILEYLQGESFYSEPTSIFKRVEKNIFKR